MLVRGGLVRLNPNTFGGVAFCSLKHELQIRRRRVFVPLFTEDVPIYDLYTFLAVFLRCFYVDRNGKMVAASRVLLRLPSGVPDHFGSREVGGCVGLSAGLPDPGLSSGLVEKGPLPFECLLQVLTPSVRCTVAPLAVSAIKITRQ